LKHRAERSNRIHSARENTGCGRHKNFGIVRQNYAMCRIKAGIRRSAGRCRSFSNYRIAGDVNLQSSAGIIRRIHGNAEYRMKVTGMGIRFHRASRHSARGARNHDRTVNLAASRPQHHGNHHGRQTAHTSNTHRHPEEIALNSYDEDRSDYCNDSSPQALATRRSSSYGCFVSTERMPDPPQERLRSDQGS
jgi:hypothetical protein